MNHSPSTRRWLSALVDPGTAIAALGVLLAGGLAAPRASAESPRSDPKAVAVADQVMETLGGKEAWQATRFLRFDFAVDREGKTLMRRAHTWDRRTGRYRVEATDEEGRPSSFS